MNTSFHIVSSRIASFRIASLLRLLSLTIIWLAGETSLDAFQPKRYHLDMLSMGNGLPSNFIDDIYQDSYGFVWVCSRAGGLVRYDGYTFDYFDSKQRGGTLLRSHSCKNVVEDNYHRLWIAFDDYTGVISLDAMKEQLPPCATQALDRRLRQALRESGIRTYKDGKGNIWIATTGHLYRLAFDTSGTVVDIATMPYRLNAPDVALYDVDNKGNVWLGYNTNIARLDVRNGHIIAHNRNALFAPIVGSIFAIIPYQGHLWLGTFSGIYINDAAKTHLSHDTSPTSLSHNLVTSFAYSADHELLIGTLGGLNVYDPRTRRVEHYDMSSTDLPLTSNFVNCLLVSQGQIWIGTESGGINKLSPRLLKLVNYVHSPRDPASISPNCVNAMYAQHDGTLWVGTVEGGLNRKAAGSNVFTHYTTDNSALPHNSVSTLTADQAGHTLWIGTWGGGVCSLDLRHPSVIRPLTLQPSMQRMLDFTGALAVDERNQGLWVGSNVGVFFYDFRRGVLTDPFPGNRMVNGCIGSVITRDHQLFIGCQQGMIQVDLTSRRGLVFTRHRHYTYKLDDPKSGILEKIQAFCEGHDGTLWIGSNGYGLYRAVRHGRDYRFHAYTTTDGLPSNAVKGIAEDHAGRLWITTDHGLSMMNVKNESFDNFTEADGLASSQFYFNSAILAPHGIVYLGACNGLTALLGLNRQASAADHLCFTRLFVDNEEVRTGSPILKENIARASTIHLHESNRSFSIEFSSLDYGRGHDEIYSYRMQGYEDDWIRLKPGQHSVRYSTLPPGHYRFDVAYGSTADGRPLKTISIDVVVTPYFYKSWWFILLVLAAATLGGIRVYHRRLAVMREREAERLYRPIETALKESENPRELQSRVQTILGNQKRYSQSVTKTQQADKQQMERSAHSFMDRVMTIMEMNYSDPAFGVEQLCHHLGMSRTTVSKKLNDETGVSTTQFIRNYRLDLARRILKENVGNRNISEIAFRVGFNDPKYFTRCFTKKYGQSPTMFQEPDKPHALPPLPR